MDSGHNLAALIDLRSISATCWPLIVQDLWLEVFKRLPIETLCRFRCVCKSWKSVISSPFFIDLHHSFACSTIPANLKPYFLVDYDLVDYNEAGEYNPINTYTLFRPRPRIVEHLKQQVRFPFRSYSDCTSWRKFAFVDLIHGVICLSHTIYSRFDSVTLWNPAIHRYLALPRIPFHLESSLDDFAFVPEFNFSARFLGYAIGFGCGTSINDFKVVRIWIPFIVMQEDCARFHKPHPTAVYQVYSAQEGLWRVVTPNIDLLSCQFGSGSSRNSCFVNGYIHWAIKRVADPNTYDLQFGVLMFNFEGEEFTTMDLPKEFYPVGISWSENVNKPLWVDVMEYAGMLSVLVSRGSEGSHVELWVMEEHGVNNTWEKLYGLSMNGIDIYQPSFEELSPYGPKQWEWNEDDYYDDLFNQIYCHHVYNESMFFVDDNKAESYGNKEIIHL